MQVDGRKPIGCRATRQEEEGVAIALTHGELVQVGDMVHMVIHASR